MSLITFSKPFRNACSSLFLFALRRRICVVLCMEDLPDLLRDGCVQQFGNNDKSFKDPADVWVSEVFLMSRVKPFVVSVEFIATIF